MSISSATLYHENYMTITPDLSLNYERQIELPLLKAYCLEQKALGRTRVTDIGGSESLYIGWLLDQGFQVTVLDPCKWRDNQTWPTYLTHPNFSLVAKGIEDYPVTSETADFALLISVLEHLGRGGYNAKHFDSPEVTCLKNIRVPFCLTTPVGADHFYGSPPDMNYSQGSLQGFIQSAGRKVEAERFYMAPDWMELPFEQVKDLRYAQILGSGASAVGYYEIE